jgi:hypothetical protein
VKILNLPLSQETKMNPAIKNIKINRVLNSVVII